ncbi:hypothetical protein RIE95_01140 [Acidithiobacillus thiooxidans]|uniref:Uncharacterized protein n=1 Tax=Acidithiobacillus thiooxidans TaxID=930 RepID=A0A1C2ID36_ACITH|nr:MULTISPECIES: hypothetical protein [Acidithiobacillus]MBE7567626.1 hypothetical protein [Acidithiobacillus sp. HP-11]MBU2743556.1 hypothetical protein [Acidithiobacillus albertensis]MBU2750175.1 hypothetical protein [Acidithiobacillus thiooxidans]MBU2794881.1 hypothetical protein [Acidithiobacillus thiooxidans]MBU2843308.1 hypothetical protein [Acidithiobacillus thiooxidans]
MENIQTLQNILKDGVRDCLEDNQKIIRLLARNWTPDQCVWLEYWLESQRIFLTRLREASRPCHFWQRRKQWAVIQDILDHCEGGIVKRPDEHREFFEFLAERSPGFLIGHPEVSETLQRQDRFLSDLLKAYPTKTYAPSRLRPGNYGYWLFLAEKKESKHAVY